MNTNKNPQIMQIPALADLSRSDDQMSKTDIFRPFLAGRFINPVPGVKTPAESYSPFGAGTA